MSVEIKSIDGRVPHRRQPHRRLERLTNRLVPIQEQPLACSTPHAEVDYDVVMAHVGSSPVTRRPAGHADTLRRHTSVVNDLTNRLEV